MSLLNKGINRNGIVNVSNRRNYLSGILIRHGYTFCMGCNLCKSAKSELWLLDGHGVCGSNTKTSNACKQLVLVAGGKCHLHK